MMDLLVIMKWVGELGYLLELPKVSHGIHNILHVSNIRKCLTDASKEVCIISRKYDSEKLRYM